MELSATQVKVLRIVANSLNGQRQIAGYRMGPYLSAARALMRKGLLSSYRTGHYCITDAGKLMVQEQSTTTPAATETKR